MRKKNIFIKNNVLKVLLCSFLLILTFSFLESNQVSALTLRAGDILINSKKTTTYYTGHAAIVAHTGEIIHIAGPGEKPEKISQEVWKKEYPNASTVIRPNWIAKGYDASVWAYNNYGKYNATYKDASYSFLANMSTLDKTYCSKLVWSAYNVGAEKPFMISIGSKYIQPTSVYPILPTHFSEYAVYNGFQNMGTW